MNRLLKNIILLSFMAGLLISFAYGQEKPRKSRTDSLSKETTEIFKRPDVHKERKTKTGKFIQKTLYRKPRKPGGPGKDLEKRNIPFSEVEGKIVRNIKINTLKTFGYSFDDPERKPEKLGEKVGNALSPKTKDFVFKNFLLLEEGSSFDSVKLLESERLIRAQRFSRVVKIDYEIVGENGDSVDLVVNSLDSWTLVPGGSFSGSRIGARLRERNFMGWGHTAEIFYRKNFNLGESHLQGMYSIPNIKKSYIGLTLGYYNNELNEMQKGIQLERIFFSPTTRWAGGAYVGQRAFLDSVPNDFNINEQMVKYDLQDFWGAYAIRIANPKFSENQRINNIVLSSRFFNINFRDKPDPLLDPNDFFSNENFLLVAAGYSSRAFVHDKYIRNFNIIEDIPVGMSVGLTSGIQRKHSKSRVYMAGGLRMGNYYKFGYLGYEAQYGGFLDGRRFEQKVFSLGIDYYTNLLSLNRWRFRGFLWTDLVLGYDRADARGDRLTFNEHDPLGINGFHSLEVIGTKKWLTNIQIQSYSPYSLFGFRLSPVMSSTIGLISNNQPLLSKGKVFTRIGLGIMLSNDFLVFSNIQVSFSWYNQIPGEGDNVFRGNSFNLADFELMDYDFGRPELIEYNPYTGN